MKAALVNSQNIVDNIIVWQNGDTWAGPETVVEIADDVVVSVGYSYLNGQFIAPPTPAPTPEQLTAQCKQQAIVLLQQTDWTSIPDVANPAVSNPYLINQSEFLAYRSQVRELAVNPVPNPVFPTEPTPQWGNT